MKKITLSFFTSLSILFAQAQYEPDVRFLQNQAWPNITQHDSIVYSSDSGSAFTAEESASLWLFADGLTDSMGLYDPTTLVNVWDGHRNGNETAVYSFEYPINGDTSAAYFFYKDASGKDSLIATYSDNGFGQMTFDVAFELEYGTNNKVAKWNIYADWQGTGSWVKVQEYEFSYNNGRLDSIVVKDGFGGGVEGKLTHTYNTNGELVQFDVFGLDANNELIPSERYYFKHNAQNEINEVIELYYDEDSTQYYLSASWKYLKRTQNNISTRDQQKLDVTIYPNPAKHSIRIKSSEEFDSYSIMSLTGKILQKGEMKSQINIEDLHKGIYFLNLKKGEQTTIKKFQKL